MRAQYSVLLFMLCLNLSAIFIQQAHEMILAETGTYGLMPYGWSTQPEEMEHMEELYDPQKIAEGWTGQNIINIPVIGDIVGGFNRFVNIVTDLLIGFPKLLYNLGTPAIIAWPLGIVYGFVMCILLIELITGRGPSD